jgi:hypothetical protein
MELFFGIFINFTGLFYKSLTTLLNFFEKVRQPCLTFFGTSGRAL